MNVAQKTNLKQTSVEAVITRADGTVEYLGTINYWHKNPLKRWWWKLTNLGK